ncbi:mucin-2-like isoform X3 [Halichondria panicea]|uniref:mucin-2-like isoform X3 n=1 Tax=Halichondria panicea TaxID=6063 RepID=UPI00312B4CF6
MILGALLVIVVASTGALVYGQSVFFKLGPTLYNTNNTEILITDIGQDALNSFPTLTCHTDLTTCCRSVADNNGNGGLGQWTYPDGTLLQNQNKAIAASECFFFVRNAPQTIKLARRDNVNPITPTGSYCCTVPTTGGDMTLCANLVVCLSLPPPTNGGVSYTDPTLGDGTVATYTCDTGYTLDGDTTTRTCGSGVWSGSAPTCDAATTMVTTEEEVTMATTEEEATMATTEEEVTMATTEEEATMATTEEEATMATTEEEATMATTEEEATMATTEEEATMATTEEEATMATTEEEATMATTEEEVTIATTEEEATMATTEEEATMSTDALTTETPTSAVCSDLLTINNGTIVYSSGSPDNRPEDVTAIHSCDASFSLVGEAVRTCGSTGEWSGSPPTCVVVCMDLVAPLTGSVVYDMGSKDSRPVGTMATYTCSTGYMVVGSVTVTCQADRTWSDSATCELICPDLSEPDNGNIVYSNPIPRDVDSTATYSCTTAGYQLVGITERMCTASGWSTGTDPTCILVTVMSTGTPTAGLSYSLTCTAELSTTATPTFQWSQDGSVITVGGTRIIVGGGESTSPYTNTLTFSPIQQSHQGAYICQVTVDTVTASSPSTDVTVGVPTLMATVTLAPSPMAGQSYSLTCTVTGAEALTPTISYQWFEGSSSRVMLPTTFADLTFDLLNLSDAGQYSCDVIVSSPFVTSDLTASSGVEDLIIQIPPPTVSVSQPPTVFLGTMFTLTCTAELAASVDVGVTVGVVWTGPDQFTSSNTMASLTAGDSSHASQLMVASAAQSGDYTCAVTLDSVSNLLTDSDPATQVRPISVVGAPSSPVVTSVPLINSIAFSWTQDDQSDVVLTYGIVFEYNGSCSEMVEPSVNSGFFFTTFTPTNLFSFSNYRMTVTAVNPVGSTTTVVIVTTLPKVPSGPVLNLVASSFSSTSVTITWDRVSCAMRNSDITGYQISYVYTVEGTTLDSVNIPGTDMREFTASGLIPRTQYTFLVTPLSNSGMGTQVASVVRETSLAEELSLFLGGQFLSNHAIVTPSDIGETNNALLCLTPVLDCCDSSNGLAGDWFYPNTGVVARNGFGLPLFRNRGPSVVRLNRVADSVGSGVYRCELLSAVGVSVSLHVGLYPLGEGAPTIPDELVFNRVALTLRCVSNGGPASEVVWTRNGAAVSTGYTLTQTVTNTATATYENVLTATTIADLVGNFTCTVNNNRGTSNTVSFSFNGIDIEGVEGLVVGSDATLRCVSVSPATMIQWINTAGDEITMTTMGLTLDLPLTPVTDTLHNSEFTCRVTRSPSNGGTGELSTTLTVIVPESALSVSITSPSAVVAGSDYIFRCEVTKVILGLANTPTAVWEASDGQQITTGGNVIITNPSTGVTELSFTGIRTDQTDPYICRGTLTSPALMVARETTDSVSVSVQLPPPIVILTTPTSPLTAGTSQELTCSVTVDTAVTTDVDVSITWERIRGSEVVAITTVTLNEKTSSTPVILTVNTMDTDYTCRATYMTTFGVMSPPAEDTQAITITIPPPPVVTISVSGDSVAGSSLSLLCTATPPIPLVTPPTISWVQQDLADTITPVTSDPSASVNLTFDPLRTSRGGMYMCMAGYNISDADLPDLSNTASTIVSVQIPRPDARITFDPMMDNYTVGLFLTLGCEVTLSSAVDTMVNLDPIWRREGVVLTTGDQLTVGDFPITNDDQVYTSLLEFQPLTRDFIGNDTLYECEASVVPQSDTFITGTTTNTSTTLTVGAANFVASISSDSTVLAGSEHTLMCQGTRGDDQAEGTTLEVEWFNPDGVLITGETSGVMITGVTDITTNATLISYLIFPSLQTSQAGPYTCRVNYTIPDSTITDQSILSSSVVTVQINTPQVMISASRSATLYEGTTGQILRCVVTPDNAGVNTTTSVTRDITGGANRATTSDTVSDGVIIVEEAIQVLSLSDTGTYTCSATVNSEPNNMYIMSATNTDTLSITVEVLPVPVVEISPSSPLPVLAGSSLDLTCSVSVEDLLSVEPLIQWTQSDQSLSGVLNGRTNTLTFDPLLTTNATQYTCTATINIPAVDITSTGSNSIALTVDIPPPTVSVSSPTPVYHGTNHTLSCNAGYDTSVVTTAVTLDYSWTGPNLIASSDSAALTLSPVDLPAQSSGDYTCTVTVRPTTISTFINPASDAATYNLTVLDTSPPEVLTGVPVREERCGQVSSITCTASVIDNFVATPTFMWRGPGGDIVDSDNILNLPSVMTGGEYTCMACVNVPQVNITNLCTNSTITIQNTTPQPVSDVVCSSISPSTLSVSWSPPTDPVLSYQAEVKQYSLVGSAVNTVSLSTPFDSENVITTTTVEGLVPSTRYLVSVEAVSGVGCSDVTEIDCYTEQTPPPVVTGVTVDRLNGTAMNVSWTPLNKAQSNGFIQSYIVRYSVATATPNRKRQGSQQVTVSSDKSGTIIGGLDPGSEYSVGVSASGAGGTSESSPLTVSPIRSVLFQLRLTNIPSCPDWVNQADRVDAVISTFVAEVESHCGCGFSSMVITSPRFRCFPESDRAVTFRATLTDSRLLTPIQEWIQTNGFITIQNVLIEVDKTCQVQILSLADTECNTIPVGSESSAAVIGGVVGVVIVLIIAVTVIVIAVLVFKSRREKLTVHRTTKRTLPPVSLKGVVSTSEIKPYEMIEMGDHEYEEVSKFQQPSGGEYEMVGGSSAGYENRAAIMATKQTSPPPPPPPQPSQQETVDAGGDFEVIECIAYSTSS